MCVCVGGGGGGGGGLGSHIGADARPGCSKPTLFISHGYSDIFIHT